MIVFLVRRTLRSAQRIVIKVGTSTVLQDGLFNTHVMSSLALQIAKLMQQGKEVVLVSSGAVGCGVSEGWSREDMKGAAAVGQVRLMEQYLRCLKNQNVPIAQVLIDNLDMKREELTTLCEALMRRRVLPIVNENDALGSTFGDNDSLASQLAVRLRADVLILLTNVRGVYVAGELRCCVRRVATDLTRSCVGVSSVGRGGMLSKVRAAQRAAAAGIVTIVASGSEQDVVLRALGGDMVGTLIGGAKWE